ncbi:putative hydrolase of the HAD superfamily [Jejuia pallidilutea]|uniref:Putative hydrolase of the HAD superfamily n=1 Tax=Jejuia pallidilutea TaxID=504487 RepID=A0A362X4H1_9FLAO|nr:HAD family hydrolase [Jejuia pallidilutea]PQV50184.1 putative hydrolase of the HAD superfamily [Jejuia pallidilutea]
MTIKNNTNVIFDLDDTLYYEVDFLKSAYKEIAVKIAANIGVSNVLVYNKMLEYFFDKKNIFQEILSEYQASFSTLELLNIYRNHKPEIKLSKDRKVTLNHLKSKNINLGLLTDGRSVQQRNKIKALQLDNWFSKIIISEEFGSEKPNVKNYKYFEQVFGLGKYYYIGDNISKDFISPNKLGWHTVCLMDHGLNIHRQNFSLVNEACLPQHTINKFLDVLDIIN